MSQKPSFDEIVNGGNLLRRKPKSNWVGFVLLWIIMAASLVVIAVSGWTLFNYFTRGEEPEPTPAPTMAAQQTPSPTSDSEPSNPISALSIVPADKLTDGVTGDLAVKNTSDTISFDNNVTYHLNTWKIVKEHPADTVLVRNPEDFAYVEAAQKEGSEPVSIIVFRDIVHSRLFEGQITPVTVPGATAAGFAKLPQMGHVLIIVHDDMSGVLINSSDESALQDFAQDVSVNQ